MFRRSSNNTFIPPNGLNGGSFPKLGNSTDELGERYPGLLGSTLVLDDGGALKYSNTSVGILRNGVYQLVKLSSSVLRGQVVVWDTLANGGIDQFKVTNAVSVTSAAFAGIAICDGTSGEYCWIQVAGLATAKFAATTAPALSSALLVDLAGSNPVLSVLADATAVTWGSAKAFVAIAYEGAAGSAFKLVLMSTGSFYPNIA